MPKTKFVTDDNLTRKKWAKDLYIRVLAEVEYNDLVGKGTNAIVQIKSDLGKGKGDTITFGIRKPLEGEGIVGDATLEGNEEKLRFKDFNMTIQELNHAVDTGGKMEAQRVPYDLVKEGRDGLQEWWGEKLSDLAINTLAGNSDFKIAGVDFAQACQEPDVYHYLGVGQADDTAVATVDAAIDASCVLDMGFLDRMKQKAENPTGTACYKVRPLRIKGKKYFRVLLHNYVFDELRRNYNAGEWGDMKRSAQLLQMPDVEIDYNGLLIGKTDRLPKVNALTGTTAGAYRCVLMGAQAACWAWGGAGDSKGSIMSFKFYKQDADRFLMIRGGGIFGMKKTRFESVDYGIITGVSYGVRMT